MNVLLRLHCGLLPISQRPRALAPAAAVAPLQPSCRPPCPVSAAPTASTSGQQQPPARRLGTVAFAKRARKADKDEGQPSGWDEALAGIPANADVIRDSEQQQQGDGERAEAAAEASEPAAAGPGSAVAAQTSEFVFVDGVDLENMTREELAAHLTAATGGPMAKKKKKKNAAVMSLAEYQMLIDAKARRDAEIARAEGRSDALVLPPDAQLDINRQSFQAFKFDSGLELLVSETVDGKLALADSYVFAPGDAYYARPELEGPMPSEPMLFDCVPWMEVTDPDVLKHKAGSQKLKRLYFLGVNHNPGPEAESGSGEGLLVLDRCYSFEARSRTLRHEAVRVVGGPDMVEPILRIRPQGITIEEAALMPTPFQVSMGDVDEVEGLVAGLGNDADASDEEELQERLEELEREGQLDELDEAPDAPSVDMM